MSAVLASNDGRQAERAVDTPVALITGAADGIGWAAARAFAGAGYRVVLADLRTEEGTTEAFGVATYPSAVLYSSADWLRTNRDTAARLARAIVKTLDWMKSHSEQEIADKTPKALRGADDALYVEALKGSRAMFSGSTAQCPNGCGGSPGRPWRSRGRASAR